MMCEAERRGYKKVRVTKSVGGWPVGSIVWLNEESVDKDECWNDDCTILRYHSSKFGVEYVEEGPVRTVTRKEIVPGVYGMVTVESHQGDSVDICINAFMTTSDLRAAIATLTEIAEALESK